MEPVDFLGEGKVFDHVSHPQTTPIPSAPPPEYVNERDNGQQSQIDTESGGKPARFCHQCGNAFGLPQMKFCPECGAQRLINKFL